MHLWQSLPLHRKNGYAEACREGCVAPKVDVWIKKGVHKLPNECMKIDRSTCHFFHKISNAYVVGTRKRRKIINSGPTVCDEHFRWHKTGKSKKIYDNNGGIKGWKKIMVLYTVSRNGGANPEATNWKMRQYHLGKDSAEKHGELVVSKVFYDLQSKKTGQPPMGAVNEESDSFSGEIDPTTPMTYPPQPGHPNSSPSGAELLNQELEAALLALDEHPSGDGTGPDAGYPENQPLPPDDLYGFPCLDYTCLGTPLDITSLAEEDVAPFGLDEHPSRDGTGPDAAYPENQPLPPDNDDAFLADMHLGSQDI